MRLFFCTDLHGSEVCFRKFLAAGRVYKADVVIMGGDCTGKMIVPVVGPPGGPFDVHWAGRDQRLPEGEELEKLRTQIRNGGQYPVTLSPADAAAIAADADRRSELFSAVMLDTLRGWLRLAEGRLAGSGIRVVFTPGNDDEWGVDDVLASSSSVESPEGRIVTLGPPDDPYELLSLGWSNPTPWDTPREFPEEVLAARIDELAGQINDMDRAIFNIHVPPHGTGLDTAAELEAGGSRLRRGGTVIASVGSTAVREAILRYQPMLSLHGHIHESKGSQRLGRTLSVNPGSAYADWELHGVLVDVAAGRIVAHTPTVG